MSKRTPQHIIWRWILLALIIGTDVAYHLYGMNYGPGRVQQGIRFVTDSLVYLAALIMAFIVSRQFGKGEKSRLVWLVLALDAFTFFTVNFGNHGILVIGKFPGHVTVFVVGFAMIMLTRSLLAWAMFAMTRIYKGAGLQLKLEAKHYIAMVLISAVGVGGWILAFISLRTQTYIGDPEVLSWVRVIIRPLPISYVLCAIFGMIIWRYTSLMGGGMVAKAWRTVLLAMLVMPLRSVLIGLAATFVGSNPKWQWVASEVSYLFFATGGYLAYLGASHQYQACTQEVPDELELAADEIPLGAEPSPVS